MMIKLMEWIECILPLNIISLSISENFNFELSLSLPFIILIALLFIAVWYKIYKSSFQIVEVNISLGKIGDFKLAPNKNDIQIAHKIWTELVTRKAAIEIDPDHDVIVEVYNSWYALFQQIRALLLEVPADQLRNRDSTKTLVIIATDSLNKGLRPHLTKWQAKYRNWYENEQQVQNLGVKTPQEVQKTYPEYDDLILEMKEVNRGLINYAEQLKKIIDG